MTMNKVDNKILKTSLFESHNILNAKMISFSGFKMPVNYEHGIQSEYFAVRDNVGIFDVSHMGELFISGKNALQFLQKVTTNDISKLKVGGAQYSVMCNSDAGIIDDLIVFKKIDGYLMVVNASNIKKDFDWLTQNIQDEVYINNISDQTSLIALQGPNARELLRKFTEINLDMPFYTFQEGTLCGYSVMISRTGYTGELGFEIFSNNNVIKNIWNDLIEAGAYPAGLAARDILRMEMGYCLYGNDINDLTNPIEAGLSWITNLNKGQFIGSKVINQIKSIGVKRKLVSFVMNERGIPRKDYKIYYNNNIIGSVTSGTQSPKLNIGFGMAYIDTPFNTSGQNIYISIRNKMLSAVITKVPLINNTSLYS